MSDLSDPEDLRRKIFEILNDPHEHAKQLKKLKAAVDSKSKSCSVYFLSVVQE